MPRTRSCALGLAPSIDVEMLLILLRISALARSRVTSVRLVVMVTFMRRSAA